jgi:NADPH:quinone reductase-like Zn-dependent oxidoreductase
MRAAVVAEPGVPSVGEFRDPRPAEGAVVIDVLAAAVNDFDRQLVAGRHPLSPPSYPAVAGYDGVGRTADGRLVYFEAPRAPFGSMAEQTLVSPERLVDLPEGADPAVAAALGTGPAGWLPLSWRAGLAVGETVAVLGVGETVAVLGAAGIVGSLAVQAAVLLGAGRVVAVVRGVDQADRARSLGATAVIDTAGHATTEELATAFREAAPGGFDVVVDYLWGAPLSAAVRNAAVGARIVNIGGVTGDVAELSSAVVRTRGIELLGFAGYLVPRQVRVDNYLEQIALATAGRLQVDVVSTSLDNVEKAWADSASTVRTVLLP